MVNIGRLPDSPLQSRVEDNTSSYTVTRPSLTKGDMGVVEEDSTATHNANLWVHSPNESIVQTATGERTDADLMATFLPSENLESDDRISYNGYDYEVQTVLHHPSAAQKVVSTATLVRKHVSED